MGMEGVWIFKKIGGTGYGSLWQMICHTEMLFTGELGVGIGTLYTVQFLFCTFKTILKLKVYFKKSYCGNNMYNLMYNVLNLMLKYIIKFDPLFK